MKLGIIGLGVSGQALKANAHLAGYDQVLTYDSSSSTNTLTVADNVDVLCVSPGIDIKHCNDPQIQALLASAHDITNDIGLFFRHFKIPTIAITGSCGKSTVVSMVGYLLKKLGISCQVRGNIGVPLWSDLPLQEDVLVLELSSYQLELIEQGDFDLGVLLNVYPHHLSRHGNFENYKQTKHRLLECSEQKISFIDQKLDASQMAARIVCQWLGKDDMYEELVDWLESGFQTLQHRREVFYKTDRLLCINDSKATNVHAVNYALKKLATDRKLILICGGKLDELVLSEWKKISLEHVDELLLFGESAQVIHETIGVGECVGSFDSMIQALNDRMQNDTWTILFSPGCQSFDEFKNFEHRGDEFKARVLACLK